MGAYLGSGRLYIRKPDMVARPACRRSSSARARRQLVKQQRRDRFVKWGFEFKRVNMIVRVNVNGLRSTQTITHGRTLDEDDGYAETE